MTYPIQNKSYTISKMVLVGLQLFYGLENEKELEFINLTKGEPN